MPSVKTKDSKSAEKVLRPTPKDIGSKSQAGNGTGKAGRLSEAVSVASAVLKIIGDPVRLSILVTLAEGQQDVGQLCSIFEQSQPVISHHLALLRHRDLVSARRQGKQNVYSLTKHGQQVVDLVREIKPIKHPRKHAAPTIAPIDPGLLDDMAGFVDDPEGWFRTPNAEFGWRKPVDLLGTADEPRLRNRIEAAKLGMFS